MKPLLRNDEVATDEKSGADRGVRKVALNGPTPASKLYCVHSNIVNSTRPELMSI
jgi:hypothetical protein